MNVCDVMTHVPITVSADSSLEEAADLMVCNRISGLPVVDAAGALIGMITEGDLIRRAELGTGGCQPGWLSSFFSPGRTAQDYVRTHGLRVREIMTNEVISVSPGMPLTDVVELMESQQVKRLPVLEDGKLVGIVSRADLLRALAQLLPQRTLEAISDAELRKRVLAEIEKQGWEPRVHLDVTVRNGIVELRGAVSDDRERVGLRVIAANTPGVRAVHDRLAWVEAIPDRVIEAPKQ
jgi:CBS domain-containing protein